MHFPHYSSARTNTSVLHFPTLVPAAVSKKHAALKENKCISKAGGPPSNYGWTVLPWKLCGRVSPPTRCGRQWAHGACRRSQQRLGGVCSESWLADSCHLLPMSNFLTVLSLQTIAYSLQRHENVSMLLTRSANGLPSFTVHTQKWSGNKSLQCKAGCELAASASAVLGKCCILLPGGSVKYGR